MHPKNNNSYISEFGVGLVLFGIGLLIYNLFPFTKMIIASYLNVYLLIFILGIIRGINKNFRGNDWWIIMIIAAFLWLANLDLVRYPLWGVLCPAVLVIVGARIILSRKNKSIAKNAAQPYTEVNDIPQLPIDDTGIPGAEQHYHHQEEQTANHSRHHHHTGSSYDAANDYVRVDTVLGSNSKVVISKNFQGGNVSSIMGSTNLILSKADINGTAYLDIFTLMGEINIIVPADFNIINNTPSLLGSVEDKRNFMTETNNDKNLVLRGQVIMGSVNIKNF